MIDVLFALCLASLDWFTCSKELSERGEDGGLRECVGELGSEEEVRYASREAGGGREA